MLKWPGCGLAPGKPDRTAGHSGGSDGARRVHFHLGVGHRGPPRQDRGPDLGRRARRHLRRRTRGAAWPARRSSPPAWSSSPARSPRRPTSTSREVARQTVNDDRLHARQVRLRLPRRAASWCAVDKQSPDIAQGVDQGSDKTWARATRADVRLRVRRDAGADAAADPLAHRPARRLTAGPAQGGTLPCLRPDGKSQVSVEYEDGKPVRVDTVVVSTQHAPDVRSRASPRGDHRAGDHAGPSVRHGASTAA